MKKSRPFNLALLALALLISATSVMARQFGGEGGDFDLSWNTVDCGGGNSSGGTFALSGTIGQAEAGAALVGGNFQITGGFWVPSAPPCPGDINSSGTVDVADMLTVINHWGGSSGDPADLNQDGLVNVADLLILINNWGAC